MTFLDRLLQTWRFRKARGFLPSQVRLIDIGAHEGQLFERLGPALREGFGIEPLLTREIRADKYRVIPGYFPQSRPEGEGWDAITLLAVLEHIPTHEQAALVKGCYDALRDGGLVIITVPSPQVDRILSVLRSLRLIDGMSLEQHHGFEPSDTQNIFASPWFELAHKGTFQLGLNHLFVFRKAAVAGNKRSV